jgi:hypothetical protein
MIVWLASYPRSGNTLLRILLKDLFQLSTYNIYASSSADALYIRQLVGSPVLSLQQARLAPEKVFFKTHELPEDDSPAIYVVRDGRDALVSYAHYVLDYVEKVPIEKQSNCFDATLRNVIVNPNFGGWSAHIFAWTQRAVPTATVRYENLIDSPVEQIQRAMLTVEYGLPELHQAQVRSFREMHSNAPAFFRKGKAGSWKEEMSLELHELFWMHHGDAMNKLGYKR